MYTKKKLHLYAHIKITIWPLTIKKLIFYFNKIGNFEINTKKIIVLYISTLI